MEKKEPAENPRDGFRKWIEIISLGLSVIAVVISIISAIVTREDIIRQNTPKTEMGIFTARSIDLLEKTDAQYMIRAELIPRIIPTLYWKKERDLYDDGTDKKYQFLFIVNRGPGRIDRLQISQMTWTPSNVAYSVPDGLMDIEGELGVLDSGHVYALLLDVTDSTSSKKHFTRISFALEYNDVLNKIYKEQKNLSEMYMYLPMIAPSH